MNNGALNMCIQSLYGHTFSFLLLSKFLGAELLHHMVGVCLTLRVCMFNFLRNCQNVA